MFCIKTERKNYNFVTPAQNQTKKKPTYKEREKIDFNVESFLAEKES